MTSDSKLGFIIRKKEEGLEVAKRTKSHLIYLHASTREKTGIS